MQPVDRSHQNKRQSIVDQIPTVRPMAARPRPVTEPVVAPVSRAASEERCRRIEEATQRALARIDLQGTAISRRAIERAKRTLAQIDIALTSGLYDGKLLALIQGANAAWTAETTIRRDGALASAAKTFGATNLVYLKILELAAAGSPEFAAALEGARTHKPAYGALDKLLGMALEELAKAARRIPAEPSDGAWV